MAHGARWMTLAAAGLLLASTTPVRGAEDEFYRGKTIRIVVGYGAGGSFDNYSRGLARTMKRYLPGQPDIVVENKTGAGGLVAANYLYNVARPDGLTIGHFGATLVMAQVLGKKGVQFDGRKFGWLGSPVGDTNACFLTKASGIATVEQWKASTRPLKIGADAPGSNLYDNPQIFRTAIGLPIQLVGGYKGSPEIRLAAESGEVDGGCMGWTTTKPAWGKKIAAGEIAVLLQTGQRRHPDLPDVPLATELAATSASRDLIRVGIVEPGAILRAWSLPPGTPPDRLALLRQAYARTMTDPTFIEEMRRVRLEVDPVPPEEVERIVAGFFQLSPELLAQLKEVLGVK